MTIAATINSPAPVAQRRNYLYGPFIDFLLMGGAYLAILPILLAVPAHSRGFWAFWTLAGANFINHPHFAHSYQIFYRSFGDKITGRYAPALRLRYIFAGIIVPASMLVYFIAALALKSRTLLALGGQAYAFSVGWHYVKQGYGMLMLDSALKRKFFTETQKKIFLVNSYVVWVASFAIGNKALSKSDLWGVQYYAWDLPSPIIWISSAAAIITSIASVYALYQTRKARGGLPWNGIVGYATSLYAWLILGRVNLIAPLFIPAFHSLQYLAVVYRYQLNRDGASKAVEIKGLPNFPLFLVVGFALGATGFWLLPMFFDQRLSGISADLGGSVFLFAFWVFINIHHYFLDNVIWRRDNPDVKAHLFT